MASPGFVDIEMKFPDPVTGRGIVVNTLSLSVYNTFGTLIETFTIDTVTKTDTLLNGVYYYVYDYDIRDPNKTPGTNLKIVYTGTVGITTLGPFEDDISFAPAATDGTTGVIINWKTQYQFEAGQERDPVVFYEVRRFDERMPYDTYKHQYVPGDYNVAFWSLDDTYDDRGSSPVTLTPSGTVQFLPGQINNGIRVLQDGKLSAGNNVKFQFGALQDFSLSLWARAVPYWNGGPLVTKVGSLAARGYGLYLIQVGTALYPTVYFGGNTLQYYRQSTKDVNDNLFHHYVASFDRDGVAVLFVDGINIMEFEISPEAMTAFDLYDFVIGSDSQITPSYFYGDIDEVIVFGGALRQKDVELLFGEETGVSRETIVGRTTFYEMMDTEVIDPFQMRFYHWKVYKATHNAGSTNGSDYLFNNVGEYKWQQVKFTGAPMCLVEGRIRNPGDVPPSGSWVKFYSEPRDRGEYVHDRYMGDEEVVVYPNPEGRFAAYLVQDAVVTCHMPDAHLALRFAVPRKPNAKLSEIETRKVKMFNNL